MSKFGKKVTDEELEEILNHDRDGSGVITLEDFKHMMLGIDEIVDKIEEDSHAGEDEDT